MMLQVELTGNAPEVGQLKELRTTLLPFCTPENGLKITVFAEEAMLLRLTIRAEKSPRLIASVGTVKICGSATLSFRRSYETRKNVRSRPLSIFGDETGPLKTP